jgi:hypothetical protein
MFDAIMLMLHGLGSVDSGIETILNRDTYNGFIGLIHVVYGKHAADVVKSTFVKQGDGYVCVMESADMAFELCLAGKG